MRDGIKAILKHSEEFHVVGEAENGSDAVQMCRRLKPAMVLMDIGLPGLNGIEATTEILRHCPDTKVVMLSMYDDEHSVVSAIRCGRPRVRAEEGLGQRLLDALRTVAKGGSYLSPQVSDRLLHRIQRGEFGTPNNCPPRSKACRRANCRCCAWLPKARPARKLR